MARVTKAQTRLDEITRQVEEAYTDLLSEGWRPPLQYPMEEGVNVMFDSSRCTITLGWILHHWMAAERSRLAAQRKAA
jgi:hypothetical protein